MQSGRSAGSPAPPCCGACLPQACQGPRCQARRLGEGAAAARRDTHLTEAERVWAQGVAGFEDLLKALERHGGALSVLTWRRSGMQTHQANRFIAMFAVAQAGAPRT
jgi:hypothetical protein